MARSVQKATGSVKGKKKAKALAKSAKVAAGRTKSPTDFPATFLWGAATAATQVDGGDRASDWFEFCQKPGNILDGSSCLLACDHWHRYESDFKSMQKMGLNAYRLGVDWSRFQPEASGGFDHAALDHLRSMLGSLRAKNIRPLLTLNHFVLPAWWLKKGGWTRVENLKDFYRFIDFLIPAVCDLVDEYVTINEPNVYSYMAYLVGHWPPAESGLRGLRLSRAVSRHMLLAHFFLYDRIHSIHAQKGRKTPRVGLAMHLQALEPYRADNAMDINRTERADFLFNRAFTDCVQSGILHSPYGREEKVHDGQAMDYFGLNYYSRRLIAFDLFSPRTFFIREMQKEDSPRTDLQWEIYPEGLYKTLVDVYARYGLPIRITENGIADQADNQRAAFIVDHLEAVARAMRAGVAVEGYYHWSLMDNFEWAEGYVPRFGLLAVDYITQERTLRPSALVYQKIVKSGRLP